MEGEIWHHFSNRRSAEDRWNDDGIWYTKISMKLMVSLTRARPFQFYIWRIQYARWALRRHYPKDIKWIIVEYLWCYEAFDISNKKKITKGTLIMRLPPPMLYRGSRKWWIEFTVRIKQNKIYRSRRYAYQRTCWMARYDITLQNILTDYEKRSYLKALCYLGTNSRQVSRIPFRTWKQNDKAVTKIYPIWEEL